MKFFIDHFKWIMLMSGILTCTMFIGFFSPETLLKSNFGEQITGNVAGIVVRNWSALIGLVGIMLIYGAFVPRLRHFILVIAGFSKIIFIFLVLSLGRPYLQFGIGTAILVDSFMIVLYSTYLLLSIKNTYRNAL